ncbi:MAG: tetratricopeptide repeat protein, partial [Candidatus Latescibacterota bacterium]
EEEGSDGSSWFPLLDSGKGGPGWRTYLETYSPTHNRTSELFGVRTSRWKYIEAPIPELYDVLADPGETRNLIAARPDTARALRADLLARLPEKAAPPLDVDEATRAKLEAIGYVREEPGPANAAEGEALPDPKELIPCVEGLHLADRHYTYGRYDSALAILGELEKACPGRGRILDHIARIEVRLGRYDRLVDRFERIVREEGANAKARFWLGLGLMESGRPAEAIESFRAAVEIEPSLALAHFHMGNACEKLGRPEEAARAWEAARRADPNGRTGLLAERSLRRASELFRDGREVPAGDGTKEAGTTPGLND